MKKLISLFFVFISIFICIKDSFPSSETPVNPDLDCYTPTGWSDSIVVTTEKGTFISDTSFSEIDSLYVDFAFYNNSDVDIENSFYVYLYIDDNFINGWIYIDLDAYSGETSPGIYTYVEDYNIGPLSEGYHEIKVEFDPLDQCEEESESNNTYFITITVSTAY